MGRSRIENWVHPWSVVYEILLTVWLFQGAPGIKGPRGEKGENGPAVSIIFRTSYPSTFFSGCSKRNPNPSTLFSEVSQYEPVNGSDFSHVYVTVGSSRTSWRDGSTRPDGSSRTSGSQWALHSRRSCKSSFWLFSSHFKSFPVHCLCSQPVLSSEL